MVTRVIPTFLLKGVDPQQLLLDYQNGVFSRKPIKKSKIKIAQNSIALAPKYGTSNYDPIFSIKDKNNSSVIIATTGHSDFEVFTRTGGTLPTGGRCDFCKEDFKTTAIGYPIAYQETTVLTNDNRYRVLYVFWTDRKFCCFECTLAFVKVTLRLPSDYRDTTLRDTETMLRMLYKLTYPDSEILRAAQDPGLLGSLSKTEWENPKHIYVRTDRVLMIPAKVEYIQQDFSNSNLKEIEL